jgi:N-methylhydantoinase B
VLRSKGHPERPLKTKEVGIAIRPGDVLDVRSGGGGGFGDPAERTAEARARDRRLGFVTAGGR